MAKRTRGSRRDRRRGGRPAGFAPNPRVAPMPGAVVEGAAQDTDAPSGPGPARLPTSERHSPTTWRPSSRLAATAEEYRYVSLDLRRIVAVIGTLLVAMLALWVAMDVLRVVTL